MTAREGPMRVRHSRLVGSACILAGLVLGGLAIISDDLSFVGAMTPVVLLGFGVAFLTRPYLIVDDDALTVKALIGSAQEVYRLEPADTIEFDGKRVFLVHERVRRRLRGVTGWLANGRDWPAFRAWGERRGRFRWFAAGPG